LIKVFFLNYVAFSKKNLSAFVITGTIYHEILNRN